MNKKVRKDVTERVKKNIRLIRLIYSRYYIARLLVDRELNRKTKPQSFQVSEINVYFAEIFGYVTALRQYDVITVSEYNLLTEYVRFYYTEMLNYYCF